MRPTMEMFSGITLLDGLSPANLAQLAEAGRVVHFAAGERIFEQDGPAAACWLLVHGRVALETTVPGRAPVVVQTLGDGDVLGWSWLIPPHRWHFAATATEPVTAVELDGVRLRALAADQPSFGYLLTYRFLCVLLDRLQHTRSRLLDLYRNDGHDR
jgi:CRP/FNR family cyclic AMP-dependent transcriptional regulator